MGRSVALKEIVGAYRSMLTRIGRLGVRYKPLKRRCSIYSTRDFGGVSMSPTRIARSFRRSKDRQYTVHLGNSQGDHGVSHAKPRRKGDRCIIEEIALATELKPPKSI